MSTLLLRKYFLNIFAVKISSAFSFIALQYIEVHIHAINFARIQKDLCPSAVSIDTVLKILCNSVFFFYLSRLAVLEQAGSSIFSNRKFKQKFRQKAILLNRKFRIEIFLLWWNCPMSWLDIRSSFLRCGAQIPS